MGGPDRVNSSLRLSEHFTLGEAIKSQTALRLGINNLPPFTLVASIMRVADHILEPVREAVRRPIIPSSWYRSPALNLAIGGSATSQHCKGQAVDFEVAGMSTLELARLVADICDFDQMILEHYREDDPASGWVHVSYVSAAENRREILRFDGKRYTPGFGV